MNEQKESPRLRVLFLRIMVSERADCSYHGFGARRLFVSWLRSVRTILIVTSAHFALRRIALVSRARSALAVRIAEGGGDNRPICGFKAGCAVGVWEGNGEPSVHAMPCSALREKFTGKNLKFKAKID